MHPFDAHYNRNRAPPTPTSRHPSWQEQHQQPEVAISVQPYNGSVHSLSQPPHSPPPPPLPLPNPPHPAPSRHHPNPQPQQHPQQHPQQYPHPQQPHPQQPHPQQHDEYPHDWLSSIFYYLKPSNYTIAARQNRRDYYSSRQQRHTELRDSRGRADEQRNALMSTSTADSSSSTTASSTKSGRRCKYLITALLLLSSFGALSISGFLLYQYVSDEGCKMSVETLPRPQQQLADCASLLTCKNQGGDCDSVRAECINKKQGWSPSAHIRIRQMKNSKKMGYEAGTGTNPPTHNINIDTTPSGLKVVHKGRYYIYYSITATKGPGQKFKTIGAQLICQRQGQNVMNLTTSEHTWCVGPKCEYERTTLYNGAVFELDKNDKIFVLVSEENSVTEYCFLGMFLV